MAKMDDFTRAITGLGVALNREITEVLIDVYRMAMADYTESEQVAAIAEAAKTMIFFPKPAELIAIIEGQKSTGSVTQSMVGNLDFELAEGGKVNALAWITAQPERFQPALISRLKILLAERERGVNEQVRYLSASIGQMPRILPSHSTVAERNTANGISTGKIIERPASDKLGPLESKHENTK